MKRALVITLFIASVFAGSCHTNKNKQAFTAGQETCIDTAGGSCPYFTKDSRNNLVLSWIKAVDTATSIVCYAVSTDEGKTFGKPVAIPGSTNVYPHGENMPKIIFKPSGEIIAAWGAANPDPANPYAGLVYYSQSFDEGSTWTKPASLAAHTSSYDQRYFDLALLPDGEAAMVWLDNRKAWNTEGSGLFYAVTNGKTGFQNERLIGGPCCPCCRTDLYIDRYKNIHVLYRAILNDSIRDMVHMVSTDKGKTFTPPKRISQDNWVIHGCPHTGPAMTENKEGLHFTWFTGGNDPGIYYNQLKDNGKTFATGDRVSGKASKHSQITSLPNDNILITWDELFPNGNASGSRIGMEERNRDGKPINKQYMTPETGISSFPVILPINANKAIIAYTKNNKDRDFVMFKQVSLP